ncbi:MAG: SpoVA/SpoVAEb family sporulation membrane protein [Bacilli bacterium]|jgi:stage V sporulation protein AE|nr:SpoVA/SpoVAEb family sporulation membrane protein [Bacilli bacterium]
MIFLNAFLLSGFICMLGQIILDNTKLTPGHVTSMFTVFGAILSFFGIYKRLIEWAGAGATVVISNFGHLLYQAGIEGFHEFGILGFFSGLLTKSSAAIVSAIIFSFIFTLIFKPKD